MIIYCDGSSDSKSIIAWGIVAKDGDDLTEITGHRSVSAKHKQSHEIVAFIESVLFAHSHGVMPENVSFYTDDKSLVDGAQYHNVHAWNPTFTFSPSLTQSLVEAASLYPPGTMNVVIGYLERSHIVWVKAHNADFMNSRADHLAKRTMRKKKGAARSSIMDMNEWAKTGFTVAHGQVYVPFLNTFVKEDRNEKLLARRLAKESGVTLYLPPTKKKYQRGDVAAAIKGWKSVLSYMCDCVSDWLDNPESEEHSSQFKLQCSND